MSFRRGVGRWFPVRQVDAPGRAAVESSLWRLPAIRELVLLTLLGFTGFSATLASLPWWAFRAGASPSAAGLVTTVMLGVTVVVQFLVPAVERRLGTGRTLAIGLLALGAPSAMYLLIPAPARTASNELVNWPARSRTRNRKIVARSSRSISRLRACWVVQAPVGWLVVPSMWM